jgi:hypothetical protein
VAGWVVGDAVVPAFPDHIQPRSGQDPHRQGVALAAAGQIGRAAEVAEQALQAAARIKHPWQRAEVLSAVAVALAGAGQADRALQAAAEVGDRQQRAEVLSAVAVALAGAGQADRALQAAVGIDEPKPRTLALVAVIPNSAVWKESDREVGRKALELVLLTSNAADHLAAFPVALLQRLAAHGELGSRVLTTST